MRGHLALGGKAFGRASESFLRQVESFRMVFDKDTLQPKGYGFADFADPKTAMEAIKILSEKECNGRRLNC